jgi:hypothetical protein
MEAPMNRKHAFAISLLLGLAVVAGGFAATRGGQDAGAQTTVNPPSGNVLAAANARLDRYEMTLDKLIAQGGRGRHADREAAAVPVAGTGPAQTQSWEDDAHGEDHPEDSSGHGPDDNSGHGPDDNGGHGDDD